MQGLHPLHALILQKAQNLNPAPHAAEMVQHMGAPHMQMPTANTVAPSSAAMGGHALGGQPMGSAGMTDGHHAAMIAMKKQEIKDSLKRVRHSELHNEISEIHKKRSGDIDKEQSDLFNS